MPRGPARRAGRLAAVDVGGTTVRITTAVATADTLALDAPVRFPTPYLELNGDLHVDISRITDAVLNVLRREGDGLDGVAIDAWSGDYGILGRDGTVPPPFSQRQPRTAEAVAIADDAVTPAEVFATSGVRPMPFSPLYQLVADRRAGRLADASSVLLLPDLISYRLTGARVAELTNASTTGLIDWQRRRWSTDLLGRLDLREDLFPAPVKPGTVVAPVRPELDAGRAVVSAVASHDTASALVAIPDPDDAPLYVSCGSWSLVGTLTDTPLLGRDVVTAGFTNEAGIDGTNRLLHIANGLWPFAQCLRTWGVPLAPGEPALAELLAAAEALPPSRFLLDATDISLMTPGDLSGRIRRASGIADDAVHRPAIVRALLDSIAANVVERTRTLEQLTGRSFAVIHLLGGGASLDLLCRLIARGAGRPVLAGPAEATTIGNLLVQARTAGILTGDAAALRERVSQLFPPRRFEP